MLNLYKYCNYRPKLNVKAHGHHAVKQLDKVTHIGPLPVILRPYITDPKKILAHSQIV